MKGIIKSEINIFNYEMEKASRFLLDDGYINYNEDFDSMKKSFSQFMDRLKLFFKRTENMLGQFFNGVRHVTDKKLYDLEVKVKLQKMDKMVEKHLIKSATRKLSFFDVDQYISVYGSFIDSYLDLVDISYKIRTMEDLKLWNDTIEKEFKKFYKEIKFIEPKKRIDFSSVMAYTNIEIRNREKLINFIVQRTSITHEKMEKIIRNKYEFDRVIRIELYPLGSLFYESTINKVNIIDLIHKHIQKINEINIDFTNKVSEQINTNVEQLGILTEIELEKRKKINQQNSMNHMRMMQGF